MKIFLDCGSNIGQGYTYFRQKYGNDYHYILFEPNPNCYKKLVELFGSTSNVDIRNEAIYIENCVKPFRFATEYCVGGSLVKNHNSMYKRDNEQEILVKCVDVIGVIENYLLPDNHIVIKLDVESSEYDILERMIELKTIFRVKKIYCEFHTQYMNDKDKKIFKLRENRIMDFIHHNGIDFEIWH